MLRACFRGDLGPASQNAHYTIGSSTFMSGGNKCPSGAPFHPPVNTCDNTVCTTAPRLA